MTTETSATDRNDQPTDDGLAVVTSEDDVEATVDRITGAIEDSPLTLVTTVDHAENAASVDEELPPTTLCSLATPAWARR